MKLVYLSAPLDNQHDDTKKKNIFGVMEAEGQNKKPFWSLMNIPFYCWTKKGQTFLLYQYYYSPKLDSYAKEVLPVEDEYW